MPIGVLLLSKKDDKYLIIDGLQRFTTMLDYSSDYFNYIDKSEISDSDLMSIIVASSDARNIFDGYSSDARQKEFENMRNIVADRMSYGKSKSLYKISQDITDELIKKIAALPDKDITNIMEPVYEIVASVSKKANIDDITIPLIIFKGKEDELAEIFQKLNQEGVRLSKYDVFAATWINHTVKVKNDPAFIDYIITKYDVAQRESNLEIANYDPDEMKQKGELTVFEYAFCVGKAIMDKCKRLFPKIDDSKIDSIGFIILAELMGLNYQNMGKLAETIDTYKKLDFKKLKDAIVECAGIVENALVPYIESPTKPKSGKRTSLVCHSELQLASYIIVIFKLKYELDTSQDLIQIKKPKEVSKVRDYLHRHYLFDILRRYWSGSGDSKLEEIISDPKTCRYTKDVAQGSFENVVLDWLEDGNKKTSLANVAIETKLFLNYLLRYSIPNADKYSYDVEHCVPKDILKKYYIKKDRIVPISSPCNLVYIPTSDNRSKGELTYYQRQVTDPGTFKLDSTQLDALGYPSKSELAFVESTSTLTEKNYFAFLDSRRKTIAHKFITALYT